MLMESPQRFRVIKRMGRALFHPKKRASASAPSGLAAQIREVVKAVEKFLKKEGAIPSDEHDKILHDLEYIAIRWMPEFIDQAATLLDELIEQLEAMEKTSPALANKIKRLIEFARRCGKQLEAVPTE